MSAEDPMNSPSRPPGWLFRAFRKFWRQPYLEELEGDLEERFQDNLNYFGSRRARFFYLLDIIRLLKPALLKNIEGSTQLNYFGMLTNNFKIAWRQLLKQRIFSGIKIGGFSVGIAACILISLYIQHQVSYDKHYKHGDRIFRLINQWSEGGEVGYWTNVQGPLKAVLEDNIPEMELVARVVIWPWGDAGENHVKAENSAYNHYEKGFFYADPELLAILEVPMVYGSHESALSEPNSLVISKRKADVYFPGQNPVGKTLLLNDDPNSNYVIGGVMEDFPVNSHLQGDFILTLYGRKTGPGTSGWCCSNYTVYTRLTASADPMDVQEKTGILRNSLVIDQLRKDGVSGLEEMQQFQSYYLQPVTNIYLNPEEVGDFLSHGWPEFVWIFGIIAGIILLLAVINFVNLSTAHSFARAKEVGLRKVVGSLRGQLIFQYLSESCLYTLIAVALGVILAWVSLPFFVELTGIELSIPWTSPWFLPVLLASALMIGVLSGSYPAFVLSRFRPVEALRGQVRGDRASWLQSTLVVFQFTATVILITSALILHRQFDFMMNKPLGYEKDQVVNLLGLDTFEEEKRTSFKRALVKLPAVQSASLSDFLPVYGSLIQNRSFWLQGRKKLDNGFEAARWVVDEDYLETLQMELFSGRNFRATGNEEQSILINQQMAHALDLDDPVGVGIVDMFDEKYTIVGVVKDFHFESLLGDLRPLAMVMGQGKSTLAVKINTEHTVEAMASIEKLWDEFSPNQSVRFTFMDQQFRQMYEDFNKAKVLFILFTALSIIIACSGLFALSIHLIRQKVKEVSIRKVLGATLGSVLLSLTGGFFKLVAIAILIALTLAWYFAEHFIDWIVHRIELSWSIFAMAGIIAGLIALLTVSFETIRAALSNPAQQLRNE